MVCSANRRPESRGFVVYALVDPRDGLIRYVGRTGNLDGRLASHESEGRRVVPHPNENPRKCKWLRELRLAGMCFVVCVLERCRTGWESCQAEAQWIDTGLAVGWPLTNRPMAAQKGRASDFAPAVSGPRPSLSHEAAR